MIAKKCIAVTAFGLAVVLASAGARADDAPKVDNPLYKAWAGHKVGSSVTYKAEITVPGQETKTATVTSTLKEKTDDGVTIETTVEGHSKSRTIPAKISAGSVKSAGEDTEIEAMDKKIKCKKYEVASEADGETGDEKATMYVSDEVVGGLVKMEVGPAVIVISASEDKKD